MELTIKLHAPATTLPPLNTPILAVIETCVDRGRGFRREYDWRVLRIICEDVDGDEDEGAIIWEELERGEISWEDAQLRLESGIEEIDDCYSDSIAWWAELPSIPSPATQGED
jgi:hypothetical protein